MIGNCLEKDAKVEYEEVFDDRRAVQRGNSRLMRRRPERRARAGNKYRAVEVSGGVEKERDYFGRRDDRYDDRRDRGYDRRGYDDDRGRVERYRPRDRYDDRRGRDDYDRRDRGRDDYDRRDRGRDDYDRRDRGRDDYDRRDRGRDDYDRRDDRR